MEKQQVIISGGSGLIGRALTRALLTAGHPVTWLTRRAADGALPGDLAQVKQVNWDPSGQTPLPPSTLSGARAIIHLAGSTVAQRWTERAKQSILRSRVDSTRALISALEALPREERPAVFIGGSAIGWYPNGDAPQDETAPHGDGFLADVVVAWEAEESRAAALGLRTAIVRTGLVLAPDGGMLEKLLPLYRLGLGSPVGQGNQWQSWIHIDDLVRLFLHILHNDEAQGVYNGVAPTGSAVRQADLSAALARALGRPHFMPAVPTFALRLLYGEMADTILASQHIVPAAAESDGFEWNHRTIDSALRSMD
jgi:uncharacterized protein (TIGR01777 family)